MCPRHFEGRNFAWSWEELVGLDGQSRLRLMVPGPEHPHKVTFGLSSLLPIIQRSPKEVLPPCVIAGPFYRSLHVMVQITGCGHQTVRLISTPPSQQITGVYFAAGKYRKELNLLYTELIRVGLRY